MKVTEQERAIADRYPIYSEARRSKVLPIGFDKKGEAPNVLLDAEEGLMTIFPFQISEGVHVYNRMSKLNTTTLLESEHEDPRDIISISAEAKKKQIIEQTKGDVIERIRETTKDGEKRL